VVVGRYVCVGDMFEGWRGVAGEGWGLRCMKERSGGHEGVRDAG